MHLNVSLLIFKQSVKICARDILVQSKMYLDLSLIFMVQQILETEFVLKLSVVEENQCTKCIKKPRDNYCRLNLQTNKQINI